ncbi:MAG: hypothetical protein DLM72_03780 [Candidatus Nitrosopolaris wilkensis]|nr:MAG: hypothetical protein DLM72_03780 [Candidatus Nitrosopolaris wilkensis]
MNQQNKIEWRRSKVMELLVKGYNHYEIAKELQISRPTISRDTEWLRNQAKEELRQYVEEKLPEEHSRCLRGVNEVLKNGLEYRY